MTYEIENTARRELANGFQRCTRFRIAVRSKAVARG